MTDDAELGTFSPGDLEEVRRLLVRRGFVHVPRSGVPADLQRSGEFASLCPATSACMRLEGELRY